MIFSVAIQPEAKVELDEIYRYVAHHLRNIPDAIRLLDRLEQSILSLREMPYHAPLSRDPRFAIQGVRKLSVGNYNVFYMVDEMMLEVSVVHVAHHLRDEGSLA
ncbi:MAG: type II toxin-antitoxin system RelE/ParE family toxin [Kiritimatiellae bacterium]|nr:type II toxin-antitoxin system RelE/ParE family toxin [Kiritimatiellia bacterium]